MLTVIVCGGRGIQLTIYDKAKKAIIVTIMAMMASLIRAPVLVLAEFRTRASQNLVLVGH
jgi:hypothetical protein